MLAFGDCRAVRRSNDRRQFHACRSCSDAAGRRQRSRGEDAVHLARRGARPGASPSLTVSMFPADRALAAHLQDSSTQANRFFKNASKGIQYFADPGSIVIGVSLYAVGQVADWKDVADLGLHGTEAIVVCQFVHRGDQRRCRPSTALRLGGHEPARRSSSIAASGTVAISRFRPGTRPRRSPRRRRSRANRSAGGRTASGTSHRSCTAARRSSDSLACTTTRTGRATSRSARPSARSAASRSCATATVIPTISSIARCSDSKSNQRRQPRVSRLVVGAMFESTRTGSRRAL